MTRIPPDPLIGKKVGDKLTLLEKIGKGGMGTVYRAKHEILEREFAVKVLRSDMRRDPVVVERFKREARAASRLEHPNVVYISDFDQLNDDRFYIVMEYIRGKSLRDVLQSTGPFELQRACSILCQVSDALDYAHEKGVIHRDLKSENIFVTTIRGEEKVKILDFGLAKLVSDALDLQSITSEGQIFGTPETMAPEQITSGKLDHRVDIYALGVLTYEMLVGKPPFSGPMLQVLMAHKKQQPPKICESRTDIPDVIDNMVQRAMEKEPERRFSRAAEMNAVFSMVLDDMKERGKKITLVGANSKELRLPVASFEFESNSFDMEYRECIMEIGEHLRDRNICSDKLNEMLELITDTVTSISHLKDNISSMENQLEKIESNGRGRASKLRHAIISLNMELKQAPSLGYTHNSQDDMKYQIRELELQLVKVTDEQNNQESAFGDMLKQTKSQLQESLYQLEQGYVNLGELIDLCRNEIGTSSTLKTAFQRFDELRKSLKN
ncbi:MAG: serine/threonine protein kinase [Deltaproteobacteria bacterium]|nr:serine/threonine protein kinase [Deltaproteobacteria bacterium]